MNIEKVRLALENLIQILHFLTNMILPINLLKINLYCVVTIMLAYFSTKPKLGTE